MGFVYHMDGGLVSLGLVIGLDSEKPDMRIPGMSML